MKYQKDNDNQIPDSLKRAFQPANDQSNGQEQNLSIDQLFKSASTQHRQPRRRITKPVKNQQMQLDLKPSRQPAPSPVSKPEPKPVQTKPQFMTVSTLVNNLYQSVKQNQEFHNLYITGGISGVKNYHNYVCYFTLDDSQKKKVSISGEIPGYVFHRMPFQLKNGMDVDIVADLTITRRFGSTQLRVKKIMPKGISEIYLKVVQTKKELAQKGYFNADHKKHIPVFPRRVAVITSSAGAVIRDIIDTIRARFPTVQVVLFPTAVEGNRAIKGMIRQIHHVDSVGNFDTVIIGRGGGSKKSLQVFNDKQLALAIYNCRTPIIASVGHGIDTEFIANYVADEQGDTPTMAADLATPVRMTDLIQDLHQWHQIAQSTINDKFNSAFQQVRDLENSAVIKQPAQRITDCHQNIMLLQDKVQSLFQKQIEKHHNAVMKLHTNLVQCNPQNMLNQYVSDLELLKQRSHSDQKNTLDKYKTQTQQIAIAYQNIDLRQKLQPMTQDLHALKHTFKIIMQSNVQHQKDSLQETLKILKQLNPKNTMKRGYSYITKVNDIINDVSQLKPHETIKIHLYHGEANAKITRRFHLKK